MAVKKIDKEFVLSDSSVNCYGFRLLTEGYQLAEFQKNPIGYFMHDRDSGVICKWEDLRIDGDKIIGKPVINMSHARAEQTVDEIENGFLNASSMGKIVALEYSDDAAMKKPGQTGPTVTKWYNKETSLVDIPGNENALVLYDENENEINLADFTTPKNHKMEKPIFTPAMLASMNLSDKATDLEISKAFNDLVARAAKADKMEQDIKDLSAKNNKDTVTALLNAALTLDKKITKETHDKLAVAYADKPVELKDLLDSMPKYKSVVDEIAKGEKDWGKDLADKDFDELAANGKLEELKHKNPDLFKQIWKKEFGTDPVM